MTYTGPNKDAKSGLSAKGIQQIWIEKCKAVLRIWDKESRRRKISELLMKKAEIQQTEWLTKFRKTSLKVA